MNIVSSSRRHRHLVRASVLLITSIAVAGIAGCGEDGGGGGGGYPPDPPPSENLEIRTWYDLDDVRNNLAGHHTLMNDLDSATAGYEELASSAANQGKGWEPIENLIPEWGYLGFVGAFDGQGHEIRDLFIDRPDEDAVGLFIGVDDRYAGGIIKDIGIVNATVIGRDTVGALVGFNVEGTVSNSYSTGSVTGNEDVGGLVGNNHHAGIVSNSHFTGDVTGYSSVGGLVGKNAHSPVSDSYSSGNVIGNSNVGGLVGENRDFATVSKCHSGSDVTGKEAVGGLVGENEYACTVSDSYSTGRVTGDAKIGGLVGENFYGTVSNSYSSSSATGDDSVGGLVGRIYEGTVLNSYSTGNLTGYGDIGGLVGVHDRSVVSNSFYSYDEVLINGENIITIGALSTEDFCEWLANDRFLDVNQRLSEEDGYYVINNVTDFRELLAFGQDGSLKFRLMDDLNLVTEPGFYIPYLAGEFDGNGHEISNLSFTFSFVSLVGLFGYLGPGGKVAKIGVENVNITGLDFVGGLVGSNHGGTLSNSYANGSITGEDGVGGLVGRNIDGGTINDSHSIGNVNGGEFVGGLVGYNHGTVSNSYSVGHATGDDWVGGLVGFNFEVLGVCNSYYNYDESLINGEKIITIGALLGEAFNQWLSADKFLDINDRLSQESGYYVVNDVTDFRELLAFGQNSSLKFRLKSDLDLASEPGLYIPYFAGEFDGNGHRISNLSFDFGFVAPVGLFGCLTPGAEVNRVGVENANIAVTAFVGSLVGINRGGKVTDCYSTGSLTGYGFYDSSVPGLPEDMQPLSCVGGLVGINHQGTVSNSTFAGIVTGGAFVGGLVGDNQGTVSNSHFTGDVTGEDHVGGLAGDGGDVSNSHSTGNVIGQQYVGGLVGYVSGTVSDCHFTGSVTGDYYVGGLVGKGYVNVSNSYSTGSVTGEEYVGGLMGWSRQTVINSYSTSSVTGDYFVGGLVGDNHQGTVSNSYSTGSVSGNEDVGGLVGDNWEHIGTVSNSFWDKETSGQSTSDGGTGKTTAEMQDIDTFSGTGWDIIAVANPGIRNAGYIWNIVDDETYPFLSWQS